MFFRNKEREELNIENELLLKKLIEIPFLTDYDTTKSELITDYKSMSSISKAFRDLKTNIQFLNINNNDKNTFLIASPSNKEGKSFIASNLAIAFAQIDKKVILIDADLNTGRLANIFGIPNNLGLSNYLSGLNDLGIEIDYNISRFINSTKFENINLITSGTIPPNSAEVLSSSKLSDAIEELNLEYDIIIIDGTSILDVADSLILARFVNSTILVINSRNIKTESLKKTTRDIQNIGGRILGFVINNTERDKKRISEYLVVPFKKIYNSIKLSFSKIKSVFKRKEIKLLEEGRTDVVFFSNKSKEISKTKDINYTDYDEKETIKPAIVLRAIKHRIENNKKDNKKIISKVKKDENVLEVIDVNNDIEIKNDEIKNNEIKNDFNNLEEKSTEVSNKNESDLESQLSSKETIINKKGDVQENKKVLKTDIQKPNKKFENNTEKINEKLKKDDKKSKEYHSNINNTEEKLNKKNEKQLDEVPNKVERQDKINEKTDKKKTGNSVDTLDNKKSNKIDENKSDIIKEDAKTENIKTENNKATLKSGEKTSNLESKNTNNSSKKLYDKLLGRLKNSKRENVENKKDINSNLEKNSIKDNGVEDKNNVENITSDKTNLNTVLVIVDAGCGVCRVINRYCYTERLVRGLDAKDGFIKAHYSSYFLKRRREGLIALYNLTKKQAQRIDPLVFETLCDFDEILWKKEKIDSDAAGLYVRCMSLEYEKLPSETNKEYNERCKKLRLEELNKSDIEIEYIFDSKVTISNTTILDKVEMRRFANILGNEKNSLEENEELNAMIEEDAARKKDEETELKKQETERKIEERLKKKEIRREKKKETAVLRKIKKEKDEIRRKELQEVREKKRKERNKVREENKRIREIERQKQKEEARIEEELLIDNLYPKTKNNKDL